ncbi:hypothetical protein BHM03_00013384, partial [Ensete ventricosum]
PYGRPATGPLCGRRVASGCVRGLAAADRAYKRARKRLPPLRVAAPVSGVGLPWRSYIPVFQIRMEKMKEVKRPPLAVSTRCISAAKLLQSDLATLVQREGGE